MASFGWSVGDIIGVVELIWEISCTLKECGGSAENYTKTDQWLRSLGNVLSRIQDNPPLAAEEDIKRLHAAVMKFRETLSEKFGVSLGSKRASGWRHGIKSKIEFRMFAQKKIDSLQEEVEGPLNTISLHLGMDIKELAQNTMALTKDTNDATRILLKALDTKDQEQRQKRRSQILKWLNPVVETQNKFGARMERNVDGTGQWLQEKKEYQSWLTTPIGEEKARSLLWITGIPGSGKTSLATSVVQTLKETYNVGFFYCDRRVEETQSVNAILRTWLWQLIKQCD